MKMPGLRTLIADPRRPPRLDALGGAWLQTPYYRLLLRLHDDPRLPESRRDLVLRELRLRDDTRTTVKALFLVMAVALFFVFFAQLRVTRVPPVAGSGTLALLWSMGALASAALVGFLFGIPRASGQTVNGPAETSTREPRTPSLTPNTNLETISDWLTKILVGVGLVESGDIARNVLKLARLMADRDGGIGSVSLALAVLVTFSALGFLLGYLLTRMFLSPVFYLADVGLAGDSSGAARAVMEAPVVPLDPKGGEEQPEVSGEAKDSAQKILKLGRTPRVDDPFPERYKRARSLLIVGNYAQAAVEYGSLIADKPDDLNLRRERLWALFKRGPSWGPDLARSLETLYELRNRDAEAASTYMSLTFHYLYADTVEAAQRVIELVDEYEGRHLKPMAGLYINKACAYGLIARLKPQDKPAAAEKAAGAIRQAINLEPASVGRLRALMREDARDNDLAIFNDSLVVRAALGLSAVKTPGSDGG